MSPKILFIACLPLMMGTTAFAKDDGSEYSACKGVTDVCIGANVSAKDSKTGKQMHGYQPGEHGGDGEGLWIDCVGKLAKGQQVPGVTGVSKAAAKACQQAKRAAKKG